MNALIAVIITIGVVIVLSVIASIAEIINWEVVFIWVARFVFLIVPTPLMIVGVLNNQGIMIFAEVLTSICSCSVALDRGSSRSWIGFIPLLPTIIFIIACIASNTVVGAVILTIVGILQFGAATGT